MNVRPQQTTDEDGFTLVELIVTVAVIAVLMAIMIPNLLRARTPAQDRQAQTLLRNSLTAAKAVETSEGVVPDRTRIAAEEPAVAYVDPSVVAPANRRSVSVASGGVGNSWYVILVSSSVSGRCFAVLEQPQVETMYQRIDNPPSCSADQFDTVTGWQGQWP